MKAITLRENPRRAICQTIPDYEILLFGKKSDDLYFNLRGYRGYLPLPDGRKLDIGEVSLARYKREIAQLNREWAENAGQPVVMAEKTQTLETS